MADREAEVLARIAPGVSSLNAHAWDRLADGDPFLGHAFLSALENSGSVGPATGWTPAPILIEDGASHLVAAAPAYLKSHSQGEYVFDHGWADAWERAGGRILSEAPGRGAVHARCRARGCWCAPRPAPAASPPIEAVTVQHDLSSAHVTFIADAEWRRSSSGSRLADPARDPVPLVQSAAMARSTISSAR